MLPCSCYNVIMWQSLWRNIVSARPRAFVLTAAGLVVATLAFLGSDFLKPEDTATSTSRAPAALVLVPSLSVSPSSAVPNQSIALIGSGFTAASIAGGAGANGAHQITGVGTSFVNVAGIILSSAQITYPINLDTGGNLVATTVVPVNATTLAGGSHTAVATDDLGATASATFTIPTRAFTVSPVTGRRGTTVTATGTSFPASNPGLTGNFPVDIAYAGTVVAQVTPGQLRLFRAHLRGALERLHTFNKHGYCQYSRAIRLFHRHPFSAPPLLFPFHLLAAPPGLASL